MSAEVKNSKPIKLTRVTKRAVSKKKYHDQVSDEVGNYEKHPFFVKKANAAKAFLKKVGLPKDFTGEVY